MKLEKILTIREAHRRAISTRFGEFEAAKEESTSLKCQVLLRNIEEKFKLLATLNEKVQEATETAEIMDEIISTDDYTTQLEIRLGEMLEYMRLRSAQDGYAKENTSKNQAEEPEITQTEFIHTTVGPSYMGDVAIQPVINNTSLQHQTVSKTTFSRNLKLPGLKLPTFSGDILSGPLPATHLQENHAYYMNAIIAPPSNCYLHKHSGKIANEQDIEATMKDRPFTYVSSKSDDPDPLTPHNLLHGKPVIQHTDLKPIPALLITEDTQRKSIGEVQHRWKRKYQTALQARHRTTHSRTCNPQAIKVGDVIHIYDNKPHVLWRLAIVEEVVCGRDGLVKLRTKDGVTNGSIT
jgi:hypothetical protein